MIEGESGSFLLFCCRPKERRAFSQFIKGIILGIKRCWLSDNGKSNGVILIFYIIFEDTLFII
ncbi:hypothetical protein D7Y07_13290 [Bacteroides acidifaciens]|uniref:Uncharacterized protein n=1 Tax=Bacteroides acidifaciens TaxID=85831 RepID=A0A3L8A669_9BACE|nr:hypothetical protein D7Y07_13290 [Bacteroides acidifaciens]